MCVHFFSSLSWLQNFDEFVRFTASDFGDGLHKSVGRRCLFLFLRFGMLCMVNRFSVLSGLSVRHILLYWNSNAFGNLIM